MQIAIDGPASAGKSTVAKIVAQKLNYIYIDTGAMYRAATLIALKNNINLDDEESLLKKLTETKLDFEVINDEQKILIDGHDESLAIRTPEVTKNVSQVSALPKIREYLVDYQRKIAGSKNVVMDGRDIGTTVLPHADLKIFLIASVESRAKRRLLDYESKGIKQNLADIEEDIKVRDYKDSHREISPLQKASDAIELDTTNLTIDQVVAEIINMIKKITIND